MPSFFHPPPAARYSATPAASGTASASPSVPAPAGGIDPSAWLGPVAAVVALVGFALLKMRRP